MKKNIFILFALMTASSFFLIPGHSLSDVPTAMPSLEQPMEATSTPAIDLRDFEFLEGENGPGFRLSPEIPDNPQAPKIIKAIEKAYDVETRGAYTFNLSEFSNVFINDPRFPMGPEGLETVRQLTRNQSLKSAGWLDYKTAYYSWMRDSILYSEAVHAKAEVEKRKLTEDERQSLRDPWGRTAPARSNSPLRTVPIAYLAMDIKDDVAIVTLIKGIYYSEVTLVMVDYHWYIATERFLSVSP